MKRFFGSMLLAIAGGVTAVLLYSTFDTADKTIIVEETPSIKYVNLPPPSTAVPGDFTAAAEAAVHAVVHVKTKSIREGSGNPFYDFFFGYGDSNPAPVMGFGSGVILTADDHPGDTVEQMVDQESPGRELRLTK